MGVDVEAALAQLAVGIGQQAQHRQDEHEGLLGDAFGRAARRERQGDVALRQGLPGHGVVVADALVMDEGEAGCAAASSSLAEPRGGHDHRIGLGQLALALAVVVALERHQLDVFARGGPDHGVEGLIAMAVVEYTLAIAHRLCSLPPSP